MQGAMTRIYPEEAVSVSLHRILTLNCRASERFIQSRHPLLQRQAGGDGGPRSRL